MDMGIIDYLQQHYPGYGPEWGSGGVFGLKYNRGILYYTLAFEAKAYFIDHSGIRRIYGFDLVGPGPHSGGDTYNASAAVDEYIYFGGWVHAPAVYRGRSGRGATIGFENKYSHVHEYNTSNDNLRLVWKESMHHPEQWVGEVSEIIYNPYDDSLLLARGDGFTNLGVYRLDRRTGRVERLVDTPVIYGVQHIDHACFSIHRWLFNGITCVDMVEPRNKIIHEIKDLSRYTLDGDPVLYPLDGPVASLMGRLYAFMKGGFLVGDPLQPEMYPYRFIRLLDFGRAQLGPSRSNIVYLGGGILVAYNMYSHAIMNPEDEAGREAMKYVNEVVSPTILLYITPPTIRIVGVFGARITSMETIGDKLIIATNTQANLGRKDSTPFDTGTRAFTIIPHSQVIAGSPPPLTIHLPRHMIPVNQWFGGIPLIGYRYARLVVRSKTAFKLRIAEQDTSSGKIISVDEVEINRDRITIELDNTLMCPMFRVESNRAPDSITIILEP